MSQKVAPKQTLRGNFLYGIDTILEKEYNYTYEDDKITRATEYDITLSEEQIVTSKIAVNTIRYFYNDDGDLTMMTKVIRETKANDTQSDTIRYDLMKLILVPFLGGIKTIDEIIDNFSYTLLFNTLIELGFLVEINDK